MYKRFAIYYSPLIGSDLEELGHKWLGWNSREGLASPHLPCTGFDIAQVTETPRKYGFHGTLKAPFRLRKDIEFDDLHRAVKKKLKKVEPFTIPKMEIKTIAGFVALIPEDVCVEIERLAERLVIKLDPLRAELNEAELTKRRKTKLTEKQENYLLLYGYPYILEEFRFHMTLTGKIGEEQASNVTKFLYDHYASTLTAPLEVREITICGEREDGYFEEIDRLPLGKR